jgi:ABC-type uncharacterized transport system substrate-binding protein
MKPSGGVWAGGDNEAAERFVRELLQLNVDVLVTVASRATRAAKQATNRTPIVMLDIADPVAFGFVSNLARPTENVTGFSAAALELNNKSLQLLKELIPSAARAAFLTPEIPGVTGERLRTAESAAARSIDLRLEHLFIRTAEDLHSAFAEITKKRPDAVVVASDHFLSSNRARIIAFAASNRLPAVYGLREYALDGGLMSLGANRDDLYHRAAFYVDKILKGAKPGDLPVEQPTKFELVINLKTAKALGLTIPPSLLQRADEIIQ